MRVSGEVVSILIAIVVPHASSWTTARFSARAAAPPALLRSSRGNADDFFSKKDPEVVASLNRLVFSPEEAAAYGVEGDTSGPECDVITNCPLWRVSWAALPGVREGYHVHMPMFCTACKLIDPCSYLKTLLVI